MSNFPIEKEKEFKANEGSVLYLQLNNAQAPPEAYIQDKKARKQAKKEEKKQRKESKKKAKKIKKKNKKHNKSNKKSSKLKSKVQKKEKTKLRINKLISLCEKKNAHHLSESEKWSSHQKKLKELLNNADDIDNKTLKEQLKQILKKQKELKKPGLLLKQVKRAERAKEREEKKRLRIERKRKKNEKKKLLETARIDKLPENLGENKYLEINIDGHNIMGCDKDCRKMMRGKQKKARERLANLVDEFLKKNNFKNGYEIRVVLWFDGKGKEFVFGGVFKVVFSNDDIVDNKLVKKFERKRDGDNNDDKKEECRNDVLVVTSDRELTLRLFKNGVRCIKSGVFYKRYLVNGGDENDDIICDERDSDDEDDLEEEFDLIEDEIEGFDCDL